MAKPKTPPALQTAPTHNYNLRNRDELNAKKEQKKAEEAAKQERNRAPPQKKRATSSKSGGDAGNKCAKGTSKDDDPDYVPSRRIQIQDVSSAADEAPNHDYNLRDRKILQANRAKAVNRTISEESLDEPYELQEREPGTSLEDMKGLDEIIEDLKNDLIWPFANPKNARIINLDIPKGLLLTGRPGTGKTALTDAIVNEIKANGRNVRFFQETGACLSKYVGESERNLRDLFKTARENAPSVIFLDEIDGLGRMRAEGPGNTVTHTTLTTLLTELNTLPAGEVLLIAATNCPKLCDPALLRKGRFDLTINLPLPGPEARQDILQFYFGKKDIPLALPILEVLVDETENTTGADLKELVSSVYRNIVRRVFPNGSWRGMTARELKEKCPDLHDLDMKLDVMPKLRAITQANKELQLAREE